MNNYNYKKLTPFKWFILENFPLIDEDFDALTNWQLFCKLGKEMNKIIKSENDLGTQMENVTNAFNALQEYVDNYFDNLDVQEEINNKLDAMVEDGTLDEIINQEIFGDIQQDITDIDNKIGDLDKLATLDNTDIVSAINTNNQLNEIFLGKSITYDIAEDLGHVQGSCINGNNLYVAVQGADNYGKIYIFNIVTNSYVGKYENVLMYHANDLTYVNNKIYIASYDTLKICVYDISNNTTTEINPFTEYSSNYTHILGVEKMDENNILCWLKPNSNQNTLTSAKFLKLNINSLEYEEYTLIDDYNITTLSGNIEEQNLTIDGNDIYLLTINPCVIFHGCINGTNININKIYNIPSKDFNNNPLGEVESVAAINNTNYPTGSIMITSRGFYTLKDMTQYWGEDTIQNYIFSPKSGNVNLANSIQAYTQRASNSFGYLTVSKSVGNLLEWGSSSYPFKTLMRGINASKGLYTPAIIQITDSSSYHIPYLYGVNGLEIQINNGCNPTIYLGDVEECDITFKTIGTGTLTIKPINVTNYRTTISNSNIRFYGTGANSIIFNDIQLQITMNSTVKTRRTTFNNTIKCSSGYAIQVMDCSETILNFGSFTINQLDKLIQVSSLGIVYTEVALTNIDKNGNCFVYSPN